ncbi:MAG TPA: putative sugar O-methyltransferase [Candidatus Elarobacter sp.]|jgi:putative sugar O-methyltransferase|nr:putative sugar O-methyltransferase [Candidatus Elarobacter sp.]
MVSSELWNSLTQTLFSSVDDEFVSKFRRPGGANNRLGVWDAYDSTMRYFKFLLYSEAARESDRFFELYRALQNVDLGLPVSVRMRSCDINIDYLLSVQEYLFVDAAVDMGEVSSVIEIGAGFGRTCHALLSFRKSIERYTIVDLPAMIELSRRFLARAIPGEFHKVSFVPVDEASRWDGLVADMAINIDSFQEMPPATIDGYMRGLVGNCRLFYVKNPVAKYDPECIGVQVEDKARFKDVFSLGRCTKVVDIFDDEQLRLCRREYLEAYRPGPTWELVTEAPLDIFPYYHHAIYRAGA